MWPASRQTPPLELTAAVPSSAVATIRTFRQHERSRRGCRPVGDLPASIRNEGVRCQVGVRTEALVLTRRVLSLGPPPTVRDRAIHVPHARSAHPGWLASARTDGLVFSAATAALALHVTVDSFIAPEPGTAPGDHLLRGAASLAVLAHRGRRLRASSRGRPRRARAGVRCAGARRSRARRRGCPGCRPPWRGLDRVPPRPARRPARRERNHSALALAQAGPAPLPAPRRHRGRSHRSRRTGLSSRSRSRSSPPTARVRMLRPPSSGAPTRS